MPPLGSTRERPFGIYTVLMIVAAAFLALAFLVTFRELQMDYEFWGAGGYIPEEEFEEEEAGGESVPPVETPEEKPADEE